jgi:hypothetical protein
LGVAKSLQSVSKQVTAAPALTAPVPQPCWSPVRTPAHEGWGFPEQGDPLMRRCRAAIAAVLTAGIVVPALSVAGAALAQPTTRSGTVLVAGEKPAKAAKPVKAAKAKRSPFAATGTVTAVDPVAGTVTLLAKGGTRDVRQRTVTVTVPSTARIVLDGVRTTLDDLAAGNRITITGTRTSGVHVAARISASARRAGPSPAPGPTPSPPPTSGDEPTEEAPEA